MNRVVDWFAGLTLLLLAAVALLVVYLLSKVSLGLAAIEKLQSQAERSLRDDMARLRQEVTGNLAAFGASVDQKTELIRSGLDARLDALTRTITASLQEIQTGNERKLEQMRHTVDEKLQSTLETRLSESFRQVSERLEQVHKGLGEMQSLASGVGDLKRVLTNVKTRGLWGEIQLGALLEELMTPEQYERNVATRGTGERVEFAIRLPGRDAGAPPTWLPVDAKFPVEDYRRLVEASERGDPDAVEQSVKQLENRLKSCARDIALKYIEPPMTTDFGIMFLPTEGLYAEAVRRPGLAEMLQRDCRVILAGPSTLAALLNSLQMGFRTLAIQQRSSEVWELLGAVKSEISRYAGILGQVRKKLDEAQDTIGKAETRSRVLEKKLRDVETIEEPGMLSGPGGVTLG